MPGTVFIVLWCWNSIKERRPLWKKMFPFCIMFLSGVIAVSAPGNYARHTAFDSDLNITKACVDASKLSLIALRNLFRQPLVIVLMAFCIYIGIKYKKRYVGREHLFLAAIVFFVALFLNSFPIALGYAGLSYLPNRIFFTLNFSAMVGIIVICIYGGMYIGNLPFYEDFCSGFHVRAYLYGLIFIILYTTLLYNEKVNELPWFQITSSVKEVKECHDAWIDCLTAIRDSEESNVRIELEQRFSYSAILMLPQIRDNESDWVNQAIAQYYGKESVAVDFLAEFE